MGAIAAALSREDRLGYIAEQPTYGMLADINALPLVQEWLILMWKYTWNGPEGKRQQHTEDILHEKGIHYISRP